MKPAETNESEPEPAVARFADELKQQYREQMLSSLGGITGTIIAAIPTVVFVVVNAIWSLRPAIAAAVASALLLALGRLMARKSVQQALSGLFGVVIAAFIAARTGQAKGYFLLGIWTSFGYGAVLLASVLVRRPLAGLFWEFLDPTPQPATSPRTDRTDDDLVGAENDTDAVSTDDVSWYHRRALWNAYMWATTVGAAVFLVRGIVQLTLFRHNATGWLAVAKISLGVPPYLAAIALGVFLVRRARAHLGVTEN